MTYTIKVGSGAESAPQPLNPVPYAKYADRAVSAANAGAAGRVVTVKGPNSISAGGIYCGQTTVSTTGNTKGSSTSSGYQAAKAFCKGVSACGGSDTAHMCSIEEMERSVALGVPIATSPSYLWIMGGVGAQGADQVDDCLGFSTAAAGHAAATWGAGFGAGAPTVNTCSFSSPIACCD